MGNAFLDALAKQGGTYTPPSQSGSASSGGGSSGGSSAGSSSATSAYRNPLTTQYNNTANKLNLTASAKSTNTKTETSKKSTNGFGVNVSLANNVPKYEKGKTTLGTGRGGISRSEFIKLQKQETKKDADLGLFTFDKTTGKLRRTTTDDYKDKHNNQLEIIQKGDLGKERTETGFLDRFGANFSSGFIAQQMNNAYAEYLDNPTEENRRYAENLKKLASETAQKNAEPLSADGGVISKDFAQWLPQGINQFKETALPTLAGIAAGNPSIVKGAVVYGSAISSYNTMRGAAFSNLLDLGVDEQTAKNAATDEALISSAIESGETALDMFVGVGKALAGKAGAKAVTTQASKTLFQQFAGELGKYGLNIGSEGSEEALQEIVSIANEMRIADGNGNGGIDELLNYCIKAIPTVFSGENTERVKESAHGGARLGALLGLAETGAGHVMNTTPKTAAQTQTQQTVQSDVQAQEQTQTPAQTETQQTQQTPQEVAQTPTQAPTQTVETQVTETPQTSATPTFDEIASQNRSARKIAEEVLNNPQALAEVKAEYDIKGTKSEQRNAIANIVEERQRTQGTQTTETVQTTQPAPAETQTAQPQVATTPVETQVDETHTVQQPKQNIFDRIKNAFAKNNTVEQTNTNDGLVHMSEDAYDHNGDNLNRTYESDTPENTRFQDLRDKLQSAAIPFRKNGKNIVDGYTIVTQRTGKASNGDPIVRVRIEKDGNVVSEFVVDDWYLESTDNDTNFYAIEDYIADRIIDSEFSTNQNQQTQTNPLTASQQAQTETTEQTTAPSEQTAVQTPTQAATPSTTSAQAGNQQTSEAPQPARQRPDIANTQDSIAEDIFSEEMYEATGGQTTHQVRHDEDVMAEVTARIAADRQAVVDDLINKTTYNDTDVVASNVLIEDLVSQITENSTPEEKQAIYQQITQLRQARESRGGDIARALRQFGQFNNTPGDIISAASEVLFGEDSDTTTDLTQEQRTALMDDVTHYANAIDSADNTTDVIALIKELSEKRKTNSLFTNKMSATMDKYLHAVAKLPGGLDFLKAVASTQTKRLATDHVKATTLTKISTIRYNNMLSKLATTVNNLMNNGITDPFETLSNNIGVILGVDNLLSKITGQRSTTFERTTKDVREARNNAWMKSVIEVGLDADVDTQSKYVDGNVEYRPGEASGGRVFKMSGTPFERLMSSVTKYLGYALQSTDEMTKGAVRQRTTNATNKLIESGKSTKEFIGDRADTEAKIRTMQNQGKAANLAVGTRNLLNNATLYTDKQGNSIGLGDLEIPFATVGANVVATASSYTPVGGIANTVSQILDAVWTARKGGEITANEQANIVKAVGRTVTGVSLATLATFAALKGVIKHSDEDDPNKAAAQKNERGGTTRLNLSALGRVLNGEDGNDWRNDDIIIDADRLEFLNAALSVGELTADEIKEQGEEARFIDVVGKTFDMGNNVTAIKDAIDGFPALSNITGAVDAYSRSDGENTWAKIADAATYNAGSVASGFLIPNALRGVATGLDTKSRSIYASDKTGIAGNVENGINYLKSGIPGLRETLPEAKDTFGNVKEAKDPVMHFISKNISPVDISKYEQSDLSRELEKVSDVTGANIFPERYAPQSINVNGEKRELTSAEQNTYFDTRAKTYNALAEKFMKSAMYKNLDETKKSDVYRSLKSLAEDAAKAEWMTANGEEITDNDFYNLLNEVEKKGKNKTPLNEDNLMDYAIMDTISSDAIKNKDYATIDNLVKEYGFSNINLKTVINERLSDLKPYIEAKDAGVGAESWDKYRQSLDNVQKMEDTSSDGSRLKYKAIVDADIPEADKDKLIAKDKEISKNWKMANEVLGKEGFSKEKIYDFFSSADWTYSDKSGEYQANGQLGAYEAYVALMRTIPYDENKRRRIFDAFANATGEAGRYDGWSRDVGKNKWKKYDYDYCEYVIGKYGNDKYGAQSKNTQSGNKGSSSSSTTSPRNIFLERLKAAGGTFS